MRKCLSGLAWMMTAFIVHAATMINVTQPYYYLNGDWHSESNKNPTVSPYGTILFSSTTPVRLSAVPPRGYALDQWMLWDGFGYTGYSRLADIPSSRIIATSTDYLFTVSWDSYYSPNWNNNLYATPCFSWLKYDLVYEPNYGGLSRAYGERGLIYTNTVEVAVGDVAGRLQSWETSHRGYEVAGWSTDPEATRASFATGETVLKAGDKFNATTNGLVTLYAVWQKKPMPIELDPQGGTVTPGSITAYIDETYDLPTPTRDDYDFNGWYDAAEGGNRFTNGMTVVRTDVTKLYAQWLNNRHSVTFKFMTKYGNETNVVTQVRDGEAAEPPAASDVDGYLGHHFTNWSAAFDDVRTDLEVRAEYVINKYSIAFDSNGGTGTMSEMLFAYDEERALNACRFSRAGATFLGWALEAGATTAEFADRERVSNLTAENEVTLILYAVWNRDDVPVVLTVGEGAEVSPSSVRVAVGDTWSLPTPVRTGYAFDGWFTAAEGGEEIVNGSTVESLSTTELFAQWTANVYSVSFLANGAEGTMPNEPYAYDEAKALTPNAFAWSGHTFRGWGLSATDVEPTYADGQVVSNLTETAGETVTLQALWSVNSYTVSFDAGGGSGSMTSLHKDYGEVFTLPAATFTKDGLPFRGWLGSDGLRYADGAVVSNLTDQADATFVLSAVWPGASYVAFDPNGATNAVMDVERFTDDDIQALTSNVFERIGYVFAGWAVSAEAAAAQTVRYADGETISSPALAGQTNTLYAVWTPNTYTVRFDRNGGQGSMSAQTMVYDTPATLSANAFTRGAEGTFSFLGWATAADGSVTYVDGATVTNLATEGTVTLYAVWANNLSDLAKAADSDFELGVVGPSASLVVVDSTTYAYGGSSIRFSEGVSYCSVTGVVHGAGTLTFKWRSNYAMSHPDGAASGLMFAIQEESKPFANPDIAEVPGKDEWTEVSYRIDATGQTVLLWRAYYFAMDYGEDCVAWLDKITWTPDGDGPTEEDAPVIDGVTKDGDGISISISTSDTRFDYQLLGTRDLSTSDDWPVIKTVSGTGEPIAFPDLINKDEPKMFYKVRVIQRQ